MKKKYDPPLNTDQIKKIYPDIATKLLNDPVHFWRATTGIELIHKEPTSNELERIWANWKLMTNKQKIISDEKSVELFGLTNKEHFEKLSPP